MHPYFRSMALLAGIMHAGQVTAHFAFLTEETMASSLSNGITLEFYNADHFSQLALVHDTVMGGRSQGSVALLSAPAGVQFTGHLSLANKGGFASVAFRLQQALPDAAFEQVRLQLKADGRDYQLRLKTAALPQGVAYVADFKTAKVLQPYTFAVADFSGRYRGRAVPGLPLLKLVDVQEISLLLADKTAGPFAVVLYTVTFERSKERYRQQGDG